MRWSASWADAGVGRCRECSPTFSDPSSSWRPSTFADPVWSVVLLCLASFSKDLAMGVSWATCLDVGHRYSGSVSGFMNMVGNMGSVVASPLVAYLARSAGGGGWSMALVVSAGSLALAAVAWLFIDPTRTIVYAPTDRLRLVDEGQLADRSQL